MFIKFSQCEYLLLVVSSVLSSSAVFSHCSGVGTGHRHERPHLQLLHDPNGGVHDGALAPDGSIAEALLQAAGIVDSAVLHIPRGRGSGGFLTETAFFL